MNQEPELRMKDVLKATLRLMPRVIFIMLIPLIIISLLASLLFPENVTEDDPRVMLLVVLGIFLYYPMIEWLLPTRGSVGE